MSIERIPGVVVGIVTRNDDEEGLGRVKVSLPMLGEGAESGWCRLATLYAGEGRGSYFVPEVGDEVMIAFEHGDVNFPYVLGSLWSLPAKPPVENPDKDNNIKRLRTRSGHTVTFDDTDGKEKIEIVDASGKNRIVLDVGEDNIRIEADTGDILISAPEGTIQLEAKTIESASTENTVVNSGKQLNVTAGTDAAIEVKKGLSIKSKGAKVEAQQSLSANGGGQMTLKAGRIDLNPPGGGGASQQMAKKATDDAAAAEAGGWGGLGDDWGGLVDMIDSGKLTGKLGDLIGDAIPGFLKKPLLKAIGKGIDAVKEFIKTGDVSALKNSLRGAAGGIVSDLGGTFAGFVGEELRGAVGGAFGQLFGDLVEENLQNVGDELGTLVQTGDTEAFLDGLAEGAKQASLDTLTAWGDKQIDGLLAPKGGGGTPAPGGSQSAGVWSDLSGSAGQGPAGSGTGDQPPEGEMGGSVGHTLIDKYENAYGKLSTEARQGLGQLLRFMREDSDLFDHGWMGYMLATAKHETAHRFQPIEEYGKGAGKKYGKAVQYVDSQGVTHSNKYYGRGYVQLTWLDNYKRMAGPSRVGEDLITDPSRALEPQVAYRIMSYGMRNGSFTGKRLSDYISGGSTDYYNARRIINGTDKASTIAKYAKNFEKWLDEEDGGA